MIYDIIQNVFYNGYPEPRSSPRSLMRGLADYYREYELVVPEDGIPFVHYIPIEAIAMAGTAVSTTPVLFTLAISQRQQLKYTLDLRRLGKCRPKLTFNGIDYRYVYQALSSMIHTKCEDGAWAQRLDEDLAQRLNQ
jgi:hypothetical protein